MNPDFNPSKLHVNCLPSSPSLQVYGRKYTLTHSDTTGDLFLSIGYHYDLTGINVSKRDEVMAEWMTTKKGAPILSGNVYVSGGEFDEQTAQRRFLIFQRELNLALSAIIYGDQCLFRQYPELLDANIFIHFNSIYPAFNQTMYYRTPRHYT
ncbi:staygreen family protein [Neobacillus sp. SAB-20_R2A]|uniref:staygreen family protein n=1 Tax=Neobacillus sp. SAB-20_R2A TaxID=3120519 RepID=UPI003C6DF147